MARVGGGKTARGRLKAVQTASLRPHIVSDGLFAVAVDKGVALLVVGFFGFALSPVGNGVAAGGRQLPVLAGDGAQGGDEGGFGGKPDLAVGGGGARLGDGGGDGGVLFRTADKGAHGDACGADEFGQVGFVGQQQEDSAPRVGTALRHFFEHGGDGRQGGEVARHQVFGGGFEHRAAFGGGDADGVARLGAGGEGGGGTVFAVQDEIDGEGLRGAVEMAHGVGAGKRFFRRPQPFGAAVFKDVGQFRRALAGLRQEEFEGDAVAFAGVVGQLGAAKDDAAHVFAEGGAALHLYQAGAGGIGHGILSIWMRFQTA